MEINGTAGPKADEAPELRLRSYQQEMLEASLKRNVIVAVGSGGDKRFTTGQVAD